MAWLQFKLENMQDAITELHFHPKWFEYAFLDETFFAQQIEKYQESDDESRVWKCLEHHRYLAFQTILSQNDHLGDEQLQQYIELCLLDDDEAMAHAALINLLAWEGLTDEQYNQLTMHPAFSGPVARKIIWRKSMYCKLSSDTIPDETFAEILAKQDTVFERELVSVPSISRHQLEVLAEKGISRAVRNMAKNRLGRRA